MKSQLEIDIEVSIKMMIILAITFAAWIILSQPAFAEDYQFMYVNVSEESHLNLRSHSGYGSIEARMPRGMKVKVVGVHDGWAKIVDAGEGGGYASINYLSDEPPADPAEYIVSGNGRVHVRRAPFGKHERWLHPGDKVTVFGMISSEGERWALIDDGYVMASYLQKAEVRK